MCVCGGEGVFSGASVPGRGVQIPGPYLAGGQGGVAPARETKKLRKLRIKQKN